MPDGLPNVENCTKYLHDYGKSPRPGRKLGHITVVSDSIAERESALSKIAASLTS